MKGVDSHARVDAFTATHGSRVGLFELQVDRGFGLSLRGVPTADFPSADIITRPERAEIIRLKNGDVNRGLEVQARPTSNGKVPVLSPEEQSWVGTRDKWKLDYMPTVAYVERNPSDGFLVPGKTPM